MSICALDKELDDDISTKIKGRPTEATTGSWVVVTISELSIVNTDAIKLASMVLDMESG